jgi:NADH-quinone oxidoreductase subunit G
MSMEVKMVRIRIDGKDYEAKPEKNLLEFSLSVGIYIPHFCFHPALGSVGACRLCAVKKFRDENDTKGRIVMSCMEPVTDGLIVSVVDPEAKAFRASVIESLMTNHPHDCPVCDEGGECHLQDMTVMTGHNYRRYDFPKRTYNNQELGPFISHEMNRCIQCYRCVRFYRDYAGGKDLNVFSSRNHVYFGRQEDGPLESEFSGNLVEVCPTGVFTDKTLKNHFTRKWDLSNAPSVCVNCSVGCNTIVSERYGSLRRIMSRYNGAVNGYFICDRGRFGYEFVNDGKRIRNIMIRPAKEMIQEPQGEEQLASYLEQSLSKDKKIIGIGSPRASLESNYALMSLVGGENFYNGVSKNEYKLTAGVIKFLQESGAVTPSLKQIEKADAVLVLGEDLTNTAPMIALALRQAVRNIHEKEAKLKGIHPWNDAPVRELAQDLKSPIFIATSVTDSLEDISEDTFHGSPDVLADFGYAVSGAIDRKSPGTKNEINKELAEKVALTLRNAQNPLIISGISSGDENLLSAALNITTALLSAGTKAMVSLVLPECNSMGLALLPGKSFEDLLSEKKSTGIETLIILENDLYSRADEESVNELLRRSGQVILLDHLINRTSQKADIVLPAATFAEAEGTFVNNEGRAQRFYKALPAQGQVMESWRRIGEFMKIRGMNPEKSWKGLDAIVESMSDNLPVFSGLKNYMPGADFRMLNMKIPRQTIRYSGRTAMNANIAVSEPELPEDSDSPLAFSMEGQQENPPSSLVPFYWSPGWNSVQAMYDYMGEPDASLKGGDPGIRLIEPMETNNNAYFEQQPGSYKVSQNEFLIIPVWRIFGSEELSSSGSSMRQKIEQPFVMLNNNDAGSFLLKEGDFVQLEIGGVSLRLKVKFDDSLQNGLAGLSVNFPGMPFTDIPGKGKLHKL